MISRNIQCFPNGAAWYIATLRRAIYEKFCNILVMKKCAIVSGGDVDISESVQSVTSAMNLEMRKLEKN
jgi:hypothetical protein